jgi:4-amino-4-deoxy-L-arabinose transferase-like glycosyltransferase
MKHRMRRFASEWVVEGPGACSVQRPYQDSSQHRLGQPPDIRPATCVALFFGFVLVWSLYGTIVDAGKSLDGDIVEAYVWGREFRLGYNQHPPFWAWISGMWFLAFPNRNWAFHLLAVVNSAVGLLGCWRLIGLFATGWTRLASFTLLLLTPFYTFLCYKYNANSIFLSIWPWTLYFLVASLTTRRTGDAVWLGVLLGVALLSKYYAVTLVLTSLAASAVHPERRTYYRSAAPYVSAGVCAVLVLPHLIWLVNAQAPPVAYIWARTGLGLASAMRYAGELAGAVALFHSAVILVVLMAAYPTVRFDRAMWSRDRLLLVLTCGPVILTILFGLVFELKISSNMMIGTFPLVPLLMVKAAGSTDPRRVYLVSRWMAAGVAGVALLASPVIAYVAANGKDPAATEPRQELAAFATRLWHEQAGTKLRIVAGTDPYENAIGFYSADRPEVFIGFSRAKAPWITAATLEQGGLLVICVHTDSLCDVQAAPYLSPQTKRFTVALTHSFWGQRREPVAFDLFLVPPRAT